MNEPPLNAVRVPKSKKPCPSDVHKYVEWVMYFLEHLPSRRPNYGCMMCAEPNWLYEFLCTSCATVRNDTSTRLQPYTSPNGNDTSSNYPYNKDTAEKKAHHLKWYTLRDDWGLELFTDRRQPKKRNHFV